MFQIHKCYRMNFLRIIKRMLTRVLMCQLFLRKKLLRFKVNVDKLTDCNPSS
jgi:hypothetical protein